MPEEKIKAGRVLFFFLLSDTISIMSEDSLTVKYSESDLTAKET